MLTVKTTVNMDSLAQLIRQLRNNKGLTLRSVAKVVGVSPAYLSRVETGSLRPAENTLLRIGEAIGANADDLLAAACIIPDDVRAILISDPRMVAVVRDLKRRGHTGESLLAWMKDW